MLLCPSLHFNTLHPTTLHYTSLHLSTLHFFPFKLHPSTLHHPLIWLRCGGTTLHAARKEYIQGESLARGPKLLSMYTIEQRGFLFRKYWQTGSFKACQTAFRMEFGERRAPSNCCIQKSVKKLETRGSRSNACRLLSLGAIEGQSVQKYTPYNRTTQRRYTPRDSNRQLRHFGKSIPEFGETHSSVLGC